MIKSQRGYYAPGGIGTALIVMGVIFALVLVGVVQGVLWYFDDSVDMSEEIKLCEAQLPRNERCVLIAVPESKVK